MKSSLKNMLVLSALLGLSTLPFEGASAKSAAYLAKGLYAAPHISLNAEKAKDDANKGQEDSSAADKDQQGKAENKDTAKDKKDDKKKDASKDQEDKKKEDDKDKNEQTITVEATQRSRKETPYDVTGLGTVGKTAAQLANGQVEGIRDITRYDPGLSVNEAGGRGGTRGFSIRGVEQERVAISVDGFASSPVLRRNDRRSIYSATTQSSAIQEVEIENLKAVTFREGASSSENGSGSLGGSVVFRTKDTGDFFSNDTDSFAGRIKVGATTKDDRRMVSFAVAGRSKWIEGFVQYTGRKGHEIRAHQELYNGTVLISYYNPDYGRSELPGLLYTELPQEAVSGVQRLIPNPMDYTSHSVLSKVGTYLTPANYLGLVLEATEQDFLTKEMSLPNYHTQREKKAGWEPLWLSAGDRAYRFTPNLFYRDKHKNVRYGIEYKYTAQTQNKWLDQAEVQIDWRTITVDSKVDKLNCMPWPSEDPDCKVNTSPTVFSAGQRANHYQAGTLEKDFRINTSFNKQYKLGVQKSITVRMIAGWMRSRYWVNDKLFTFESNVGNPPVNGRCETGFTLVHNVDVQTGQKEDVCQEVKSHDENFSTGVIDGDNFFVGISQTLHWQKFGLSSAFRLDRTIYKHHPGPIQKARFDVFEGARYTNPSVDVGVSYKPIRQLQLSARFSTGFRVPSPYEEIGPSFNTETTIKGFEQGPLQAEFSKNFELGMRIVTPTIKLSGSYFFSHYTNIIDIAAVADARFNGGHGQYNYHNMHDFWTHGFNVKGSVDLHEFWHKLPEGMEAFVNVGIVSILGKPKVIGNYSLYSSYSFDAVQPLKMVYGLNYFPYSEKWGFSITNTLSDAKDPRELQTNSRQGGIETHGVRYASVVPGTWYTTDVQAFWRFKPYITLRLGIYNLFNYRYVTWESARQASWSLQARINTPNLTVLAAPGRNYQLTLEAEF